MLVPTLAFVVRITSIQAFNEKKVYRHFMKNVFECEKKKTSIGQSAVCMVNSSMDAFSLTWTSKQKGSLFIFEHVKDDFKTMFTYIERT